MESEQADSSGVVYGPWDLENGGEARIVHRGDYCDFEWHSNDSDPWQSNGEDSCLEEAELTAQLVRVVDELVAVSAGRDRLRALVAKMRRFINGEVENEDWRREGEDLLDDDDGRAARAWLREREEKAAEPWKTHAARALAIFGVVDGMSARSVEESRDWLASRLAQAREEGRAKGLYEEREVCAALVEVVGCLGPAHCGGVVHHDPRCPIVLAESLRNQAKGAEVPPAGARDGNP